MTPPGSPGGADVRPASDHGDSDSIFGAAPSDVLDMSLSKVQGDGSGSDSVFGHAPSDLVDMSPPQSSHSGSGDSVFLRQHRRRRRRRLEPKTVPEEIWRRFTPVEINDALCMARLWGAGGRGAQCNKPRAADTDLCQEHAKSKLVHGRVDGPFPHKKL